MRLVIERVSPLELRINIAFYTGNIIEDITIQFGCCNSNIAFHWTGHTGAKPQSDS